MAGPIDVSQSPTKVNKTGEKLNPHVLEMLKLVIPEGKEAGSGRAVYPGAVQISGFISTKFKEHLDNYRSLAFKMAPFTPEEEKQIAFYQEYFAVMDLPHEFYKDTVNRVFRGNEWAKGSVEYNGEIIDLSWMTRPLMTVE
jgi:poly(3-hydroxybutyrate) depolymerase